MVRRSVRGKKRRNKTISIDTGRLELTGSDIMARKRNLNISIPSFRTVMNFNDGVNGEKVSELTSNFDTRYSNAQAYEGTQSAICNVVEGTTGWAVWGGIYAFPINLYRGHELWLRLRCYWPSGFDYSTPGVSRLKFLRIKTLTSEDVHIGYNDMYINNQDDAYSNGPYTFIYEGAGGLTNMTGDDWATYGIEFDTWETYEFYLNFDHIPISSGGNAVARFWKNGELLIETPNTQKTLQNSGDYAKEFYLFTYWNNNAPATQFMYVDNITLTTRRPDNQDQSGNYFLGL